MAYLFNRRAVFEVDTLVIEGLDIKFEVVMDDKNLGKARIDIYNLNSTHRAQLQEKKSLIGKLSLGYENTGLDTFFSGSIRTVYSERQSPDWITTLTTGDGDAAVRARINKSYRPGMAFQKVWGDAMSNLHEQAGIGIGKAIEAFRNGKIKNGVAQLANGGNLQGSTLKEVQRLARTANLNVFIQDGELVVTEIDKPLDSSAIILSPSSGLISSPQKGNKGLLKVKSLIIPGLRPRRKISVNSTVADGYYVIRKGTYRGDTSGNDWYADLECQELDSTGRMAIADGGLAYA